MEDNKKILSGLYDLKTNLLNRKVHYENKINLINAEIKDINTKICEHEGHTFGQWYDATDYCFCYVRTCSRCNKVEYSIDKPKILEKK